MPMSRALLILALPLAACAGGANQGPLQPQTVEGPCHVQNFFLLSQTAVQSVLSVARGGTCAFTLINPDLQVFPSAVVISEAPTHGRATADLVNGGRSPRITYTPLPGPVAPDHFTVTIEPNDHAVSVIVTH